MQRARVLVALFALTFAESALADEPRLTDPEFARLVKQLHVKNQPWASIHWQTSVTEARRQAAREQKPIFFNVNTGNALGFT
jgi:hypothetical protein